MEIVFGLLVLVLIVLGLRKRKKENKTWVKEERYEESGQWIDKRSGERGTYGALDDEMESNRIHIARQSKVSELAMAIQATCFAHQPDNYADNEAVKRHLAWCKSEITGLFEKIDLLLKGQTFNLSTQVPPKNDLVSVLKKQMLDYVFQAFPKLLDQEIEPLKKLDLAAEQHAARVAQPG